MTELSEAKSLLRLAAAALRNLTPKNTGSALVAEIEAFLEESPAAAAEDIFGL